MDSYRNLKVAGLILFLGVAQFILLMLLAEFLYPHYSVSSNFISDLGVGKTAIIFNSSIILFGVFLACTGALLRRFSPVLFIVLLLAGVGAAGVGLFPETTGTPHLLFSLLVFLMGSIAPYIILNRVRNSLAVAWSVLGTIALFFLVFYMFDVHLGLGAGGMERMIVYPDLIWALGFGGWLMGKFSDKTRSGKAAV